MPSRQKQPQKLYWKDALQALHETREQQVTRHRMWQHAFGQAKADLQREEAIIFLGENALDILRAVDDPPPPASPPAPVWPALLAGAATLAAAAAAYSLSLARVRAGMR